MSENSRIIRQIRGRAVVVRGNDIDTDRIIPSRYMKGVSFDELGQYAFYDVRFDSTGKPTNHPFNDPRYQNAPILLVNKNFGCGSSREHAPQALMRCGVRAVVGQSYAEIFAGNCTAIGMPAVQAAADDLEALMQLVEADPRAELALDLAGRRLRGQGATGEILAPIEISEARLQSFLTGTWDTTGLLLDGLKEIKATAARLPYLSRFPYPDEAGVQAAGA
jgi:3-isopropylmalate/(R)-2-methylmalate dehydratase small subunit